MLRPVLRFFCLTLLPTLTTVALAQDFSADVATAKNANGIKKLYATKDKVRLDSGDASQPMGPSAVIIDEVQRKWIVLLAARHMYMDSLPQMMKVPLATQLWHVQDVDDACSQWKKVADQAHASENWGSCTKVGNDTVNGRSTVKYEGVSRQGDKNHFWVDTKLHCVIKSDGGSGFELQNIREGSQPASLFEIPDGFTRFDLGGMMQRPQ